MTLNKALDITVSLFAAMAGAWVIFFMMTLAFLLVDPSFSSAFIFVFMCISGACLVFAIWNLEQTEWREE